jgi:putative ABC transport system permease protein
MAASTLLLLVLLGARESVTRAIVAYTGQPGCDLWIAPRGTDNLIRSGSFLPASLGDAIRADPEVAAVEPLLRTFVAVEHGERRVTLLAIGYRSPAGLGGPPRVVAGRPPAHDDELVLDRAAAHRLGAVPGSTVLLNGVPMRVSGITRETNLIGTQLAFGDHDEAENVMGVWGRASFLVVRLVPGADPREVATRLAARLPTAAVFTRDAFVANNAREVAAGLGPLLLVLAGLGATVSVTLVALLAHAVVDDRRGDLALLLSLGTPVGALAWSVVARMTGVAAAGAVGGGVAALALSSFLDRAMPTVELAHRASDWGVALALCCTSAALAAVAPVRRLRNIDPLEAFRP